MGQGSFQLSLFFSQFVVSYLRFNFYYKHFTVADIHASQCDTKEHPFVSLPVPMKCDSNDAVWLPVCSLLLCRTLTTEAPTT